MFFERKSRPSSVICFIFMFINTILVVFAKKKSVMSLLVHVCMACATVSTKHHR